MIDIRDDGVFIDVTFSTEYDGNLNNCQGGQKTVAKIGAGPSLIAMESRITKMELEHAVMAGKIAHEESFRSSHPAVMDAWEKYQVVIALTQQKEEFEESAL